MLNRKTLMGMFFLVTFSASACWCNYIPKGPQALRPHPGGTPVEGIDQETWLIYDDGTPAYYFPIPDQYDDHYFNVRFTAPAPCSLLAAEFVFDQVPGDTSSLPDVHVLVWSSTGLYPDLLLDSLILDDDEVLLYPDSTLVPLDAMNLYFIQSAKFHIGWEPDSTDSTDGPLAILADDGIPATNYSGEWWGEAGSWGTIQTNWGLGVNFFIRAQVELYSGEKVWLEPDMPSDFSLEGPFPNPFNPEANFVIHLRNPQEIRLEAYDLTGQLVEEITGGAFPAGQSLVTWRPPGLSSGTYLVVLKSESGTISTKAVLIK